MASPLSLTTGVVYLAPTASLSLGGKIKSVNSIAAFGSGVPIIVANPVHLINQTADVGTTTLLASAPQDGTYLVMPWIAITTPASVSSTLPPITLNWNNGTAAYSFAVSTTQTGNTTTTTGIGSSGPTVARVIHVGIGQAVTISTTGYASSGTTPMAFELYVTIVLNG